MFKVKTFRSHWAMEDSLGRDVQNFLNNSHLNKENIIDARRKIIKAFWPEVPDRYVDNTVACAEHLLEDYEIIE